jgi:hypothetical protein
MLKLSNDNQIKLSIADAELLGVERFTTVGAIRDMIKPQEPKQIKMIEIEDDLNMEL